MHVRTGMCISAVIVVLSYCLFSSTSLSFIDHNGCNGWKLISYDMPFLIFFAILFSISTWIQDIERRHRCCMCSLLDTRDARVSVAVYDIIYIYMYVMDETAMVPVINAHTWLCASVAFIWKIVALHPANERRRYNVLPIIFQHWDAAGNWQFLSKQQGAMHRIKSMVWLLILWRRKKPGH